jgi:hypothetical protein
MRAKLGIPAGAGPAPTPAGAAGRRPPRRGAARQVAAAVVVIGLCAVAGRVLGEGLRAEESGPPLPVRVLASSAPQPPARPPAQTAARPPAPVSLATPAVAAPAAGDEPADEAPAGQEAASGAEESGPEDSGDDVVAGDALPPIEVGSTYDPGLLEGLLGPEEDEEEQAAAAPAPSVRPDPGTAPGAIAPDEAPPELVAADAEFPVAAGLSSLAILLGGAVTAACIYRRRAARPVGGPVRGPVLRAAPPPPGPVRPRPGRTALLGLATRPWRPL